jgi:hypothetical protein
MISGSPRRFSFVDIGGSPVIVIVQIASETLSIW